MPETTRLAPAEEIQFRVWARANNITDVDHPDSHYDYRGYWKQIVSQGGEATKTYADGLHFTDEYKQHGHPTFSVESRYSAGPWDGGRWNGEDFVPPGADMLMNSRGQSRQGSDALARALQILSGSLR